MPDTATGIETPGGEPESVNTEEGFKRYLRDHGGSDLPAAANELGAPNSAHRKAYVQRAMDEGWKKAEAQITSKAELDAYLIGSGPGTTAAGIELPKDDPEPEPALIVQSPEEQQVRRQLYEAQTKIAETESQEAMLAAYDALDEAEDEQDVHQTLSQLRESVSEDDWNAFTLNAVGDGTLDPEELNQSNHLYEAEQTLLGAQTQAENAEKESKQLATDQAKAVSAELDRLGLKSEQARDLHLQDIAEAIRQVPELAIAHLPAEEYGPALRKLSALVSEGRRATLSAAVQNEILNQSSGSVASGLELPGGVMAYQAPEVEPQLDFRRLLQKEGTRRVDFAAEIMKEEKKSRAFGEESDKLYREAVRANEARAERKRRGVS